MHNYVTFYTNKKNLLLKEYLLYQNLSIVSNYGESVYFFQVPVYVRSPSSILHDWHSRSCCTLILSTLKGTFCTLLHTTYCCHLVFTCNLEFLLQCSMPKVTKWDQRLYGTGFTEIPGNYSTHIHSDKCLSLFFSLILF